MLLSVDVTLLDEPQLIFAQEHSSLDPKIGLLSYGPCGLDIEAGKTRVIRAGAIGTHSSLMSLKFFLRRLLEVIPTSDSKRAGGEPWKREFLGLGVKGPLGLEIDLDPSAVESISNEEQEVALRSAGRQERIINAVALYDQKLQDLAGSTHPAPQVALMPLSVDLVAKCKDPSQKGDRI